MSVTANRKAVLTVDIDVATLALKLGVPKGYKLADVDWASGLGHVTLTCVSEPEDVPWV